MSRSDPGEADGLPGASLEFVEGLWSDWLRDPGSVPEAWRAEFERLGPDRRPAPTAAPFPRRSLFDPAPPGPRREGLEVAALQDRVDQIVRAYRVRGHLVARLDPLGRPRPFHPELDPSFYRLTRRDMDRVVSADTVAGADALPLREVLARLRATYCRSIGVQYMHIDDLELKRWLEGRMESSRNRIALSHERQVRILTRLTDAELFEEFVQRKFVGAKRFSLEGAESLIPLLDLALQRASAQGVAEAVLAMAHRGRLNVLANVVGKRPREIFREFEDRDPRRGGGDVKYHLGHSGTWTGPDGREVHVSLCFNPSHLEYVAPVALGRLRAKQDRAGPEGRDRGMVILIHGDAAFAGEGVVQETLSLSDLPAYSVGGALHVVVNNQVGFTTPPEEARSSPYATDVAKMLQIPIFHVNGEDPEAVAQVVELALDFRSRWRRDVVVDMWCYRRRGHNEADEPSFTQPLMYRRIAARESVRQSYLRRLLRLGGVTQEEADEIGARRRAELERDLAEARSDDYLGPGDCPEGLWEGYLGGRERDAPDPDTGFPKERLAALLDRLTRAPEGFHLHPKIARGLERRREMAREERPLDWSAGEALAFASLAVAGHPVRLTGQDTQRGTFSQRHAAFHDVEDGSVHLPFAALEDGQAPVEILNSPLDEAAVLGFEYGYSLDAPASLVGWEAQFGDFWNAAQVVVDQFLASAEDKWNRLSGVVLLLPHGYEGQGPEHSSARLERFLALCAEDNLQVVQPTTPAQYFHVLRRQVVRPWRKPLVVMTPKSLLRHPRCVSALAELAEGRFRRVLPDDDAGRQPARVLLCTGKVYYELAARRKELGRDDVAIVRLEQLHPFPDDPLRDALAACPDGTPAVWVQEEPENMGAWPALRLRFGSELFRRLPFVGVTRAASASPATGSASTHALEQEELLERAFGGA